MKDWRPYGSSLPAALTNLIALVRQYEKKARRNDSRPWWVLGAEVHQQLEIVAMLAAVARFSVKDNDDGFCLREQLYLDGCRDGINREAGARLRKAARLGKKK